MCGNRYYDENDRLGDRIQKDIDNGKRFDPAKCNECVNQGTKWCRTCEDGDQFGPKEGEE